MSKMLSVRLPDALYDALEAYAKKQGETVHKTTIILIERGLSPKDHHQTAPRLPETANYTRPAHAPGCKCYMCKPPKD